MMKPKHIIFSTKSGENIDDVTTTENEFLWADGDENSVHMKAGRMFAAGWNVVQITETVNGSIVRPVA